jgi:ATP-dependent DNA helicase RecG
MATLIEELLAQREGTGVDFKVDASSPRGIVKCFVALGNTAGGWVVVGVDDDRNVVGLEDPQGVEQAISNAIYDSTEPPQRPRIMFATHEEKEVVLVDAQFFQGAEPLKLKEGEHATVYERVGSNAVPVSDQDRLEQIRRERQGRAGFDQLPATGAKRDDLDLKAIKATFGRAGVEIDEAKLVSYELAVRQRNGSACLNRRGRTFHCPQLWNCADDRRSQTRRNPSLRSRGSTRDPAQRHRAW